MRIFRYLQRSSVADLYGFTLVETMVTVAIASAMIAVVYGLLGNTRSIYFDTNTKISLRNEIRAALYKIQNELRFSGYDGGTARFTVYDGAGANGSDIIRFSVPVICESGANYLDQNGDPAHWGAPLTWGCSADSSCYDADDHCATVEYKFVQYELTNDNEVLRSVLSPTPKVVRVDVIARAITDLQFTLSGSNTITVALTAASKSDAGSVVTATGGQDVFLVN